MSLFISNHLVKQNGEIADTMLVMSTKLKSLANRHNTAMVLLERLSKRVSELEKTILTKQDKSNE